MIHENTSQWPAFGSSIRKIGASLYAELERHRKFMFPKWKEQIIKSWEELEKHCPEMAKELFERLRKIERSYRKKLGLPSDERMLKEVAVEVYNFIVMEIDTLHTEAMLGNVESIFRLSSLYLTGDGVPQDQALAFQLLRYAAEQGLETAIPLLGECYAKGLGTTENPEEAVKWILRSDYSQDAELLAFLGVCYQTGTGLPRDEEQAWHHILEAVELRHRDGFHLCKLAANAGNARGQYLLGMFYQHGHTIPADIQAALHWFLLSAQQNYAAAQCMLGILYNDGNYGIEKDLEAAVAWYKRAAAQNDRVAKHQLAHCLAFELGVPSNPEEAAGLWKELVDTYNDAASQYRLGTLLACREYSGYSPAEGIKLLRKSAAQNYGPAQLGLGQLHSTGLEGLVKQDWKEARKWFHKAAKQGSETAQYYLGEIFLYGNGIQENRKEAFYWYKKSADNGYSPAAQKLSWCYLNGVGTRKNEEEGYTLLAALALIGDEEALTLLRSAATSGNAAAELGLHYYYRDKTMLRPLTIGWKIRCQ